MKLAVSNIAWPKDQDDRVADAFKELGVGGIEIAPTKIWPQPLDASSEKIEAYRRFWSDRGLPIVAAQALLFGRPELTLFDSTEAREEALAYLSGIVRLCAALGAKALVFGSPKNRRIGTLSRAQAWPIAVEFFTRLGEVAAENGTCVVLEANPPAYGADFITHAEEAIELVAAVDRPGFQLHLDTACMVLADDPAETIFETGFPYLRHFHVSEPELASIGGGRIDHVRFAQLLREHDYSGWISIEMREQQPFSLDDLRRSVEIVQQTYG